MEQLYTYDKNGKPRMWRVEVVETDHGTAIIRRSYGQVNGQITTTEREITQGKNKGRSNETTPFSQAMLEAKSLHDKQLSEGYVRELTDNTPQKLFPMLAHTWEDRAKYVQAPFYVQPKLDGVRMLVGRLGGQLIMVSRTGKTVHHLDHLRAELEPVLRTEGIFLDGESYNHDKSFEDITGMCRTTLESSASEKNLTDIQFHVFDMFDYANTDVPFFRRLEYLDNLFFGKAFKYVKQVETRQVTNKEDVEKINPDYVARGYEGTIIRNRDGPYQLNERSNNLLKYKSFNTDEFTIVGAEEAEGRDKGTVIWICESHLGAKFRVRPRGSLKERKQYWVDRWKWTTGHTKLTVQYQNVTVANGVPRFPVGLGIRNYE